MHFHRSLNGMVGRARGNDRDSSRTSGVHHAGKRIDGRDGRIARRPAVCGGGRVCGRALVGGNGNLEGVTRVKCGGCRRNRNGEKRAARRQCACNCSIVRRTSNRRAGNDDGNKRQHPSDGASSRFCHDWHASMFRDAPRTASDAACADAAVWAAERNRPAAYSLARSQLVQRLSCASRLDPCLPAPRPRYFWRCSRPRVSPVRNHCSTGPTTSPRIGSATRARSTSTSCIASA